MSGATQTKVERTRIAAGFVRVDERQHGDIAYFRATRSKIAQTFGPSEKLPVGDGKVSSEWMLRTPKGHLVTIYDWREDYGGECAWQRRKHIVVRWHVKYGDQTEALQELGEALGEPIVTRHSSSTNPRAPHPNPEIRAAHETGKKRLIELVEAEGQATGIFKLPVGDRNPLIFNVDATGYQNVLRACYKDDMAMYDRLSGRLRVLRWDSYRDPSIVGLIFAGGEELTTQQRTTNDGEPTRV